MSTREHTSQCNKYFKCIKLPFDRLSWITLTCPEGLVYDKNLRSCAIPADNWDCPLPSSGEKDGNGDDDNVLGVENLRILNDEEDSRQAKDDDSDEFLEVIDGEENLASELRSSDDAADFSGDGAIENFVTPASTATKSMITTQVQRLTQLVNHMAKGANEDLNPDDLNSFLDRQRIQYENFGLSEGEKTPLPKNGKIHPEVITEIINQQNNLKQLTTLSMDRATTTMRPFEIDDKNLITEIKLKGGQGLESGSHQIVVNRPEGSVLFNVPATPVTKNQPYLSADILKTILELSKNLVTNNQKSSQNSPVNYQPQPVYYAIPVPIYQNQNYYGSNYQNHSQPTQTHPSYSMAIQSQPSYSHITTKTTTTTTTTPKPRAEIKSDLQTGYSDNYGNYYTYPQTSNYPNYNNYPSYANQQYGYNPFYNNYYQQYPQNNRFGEQSGNFNAAYYEKRPFVIDSSPPSYVEHHQQPFRKEENIMSDNGYDTDDEESDNDDDDDHFFDERPPKDPTDGLICTTILARQANKTDCFKYYVCNAKTKEILTYTCPPKTAFNDLTKFCDSSSYNDCKKMQDNENRNSIKNRRIVSEAHKVLAQAKRESQKAKRIANLMRKESQKFFYNRNQFNQPSNDFYEYQKVYQPTESSTEAAQEEEIEIPIRQTIAQRRTTRPQVKKKKKKSKKVKCVVLGELKNFLGEKINR